jgi:hypothetical protein
MQKSRASQGARELKCHRSTFRRITASRASQGAHNHFPLLRNHLYFVGGF